jgi:hypothetical protein
MSKTSLDFQVLHDISMEEIMTQVYLFVVSSKTFMRGA